MIEIREFLPDDYDAVMEIWRHAQGVVLRPADERSALLFYLSRNRGLSFVARDDGTVVGGVLCGTDGRRGYLQHLAVRATHRRRGIGRMLARATLDALSAQGITKCHLFIVRENTDAAAFWRSVGWQERLDIEVFSHGQG